MAKKGILEDWINVPALMKTEYGDVEGVIKYGVKLPMKPGTHPLREIELSSKEKINGEKGSYWFVNDEEAIKIRLVNYHINENEITGKAHDVRYFKYVVRKA